jgi:hypothetical protein
MITSHNPIVKEKVGSLAEVRSRYINEVTEVCRCLLDIIDHRRTGEPLLLLNVSLSLIYKLFRISKRN